MSALRPGARVHVVGVGGAGMSALAVLLAEMGATVSGSDARDSDTLRAVARHGVTTHVGHDRRHAEGSDVVVWSPAVAPTHEEIAEATSHGALALSRAMVMSELASLRRVVGLTGTHGKTTATSMFVAVSRAAGRDDGWLVGAPVDDTGVNGHWGTGDLIVEVDESYGTFTSLAPYALGLLNVEPDHLDFYGTVLNLEEAFRSLVERTRGPVVAWDDANVRRVLSEVPRDVTWVSMSKGTSWWVDEIRLERRGASFRLREGSRDLAITLGVTGLHNVANAAVTAVLALELEYPASAVRAGLASFSGAPRRFEFRGRWRDLDVYDDYAHLPGEVRATLAATRAAGYDHVTAVFQPHRFTRTSALSRELGESLAGADFVIVTDIYSAGEPDPGGVSGELVANAAARIIDPHRVTYAPTWDEVVTRLQDVASESDVVVLLGAGDVARVLEELPGGLR